MIIDQPIVSGSFSVTGSSTLIGNLVVTGSITATEGIVVSGSILSSSYALSSSYSVTASFASTSSYVENAQSASYVLNAVSSSYALSASYAANVPATSSYALEALSSSYSVTASYAANVPETASYALSALSSSYALTASYSANVPVTSSYALQALSASIYQNASAKISSSISFLSSGSHKIYSLSYFRGAMVDYVVNSSGSNDSMRAGTFTATWNATSSVSNESMTMDIGNTSAVQFSTDTTGSIFVNITSGSWEVDSLYRALGVFTTGSAPTPPPSPTSSFGFYNQQFTIYTGSAIVSQSVLYTDAGLTTPYPYVNINSNNYKFQLQPPSGSVVAITYNNQGSYIGIDVGENATPLFKTALTYPVPYDSLIEAYNNNAPIYSDDGFSLFGTYLPYFTGWTTISDGKYVFDYDDTTGLLSNPVLAAVSGGYSTYLYEVAVSGNNFNAGNAARLSRPGTYYYSGSVLDAGIQLYTDTALTSPAATNQTSSDGYYVYTVNNGLVVNKSAYTVDFYVGKRFSTFKYVSLEDKCTVELSGSIDLYFNTTFAPAPSVIWYNPAIITTYYTDNYLTPYTASGDVLNFDYYGSDIGTTAYTVTDGVLTYVSACDTFVVGLSDISGPDACSNYSSDPVTIYSTGFDNLSSAASSGGTLWYASNNTQITASYISDGTNSYPVTVNIYGTKRSEATNSPTPC